MRCNFAEGLTFIKRLRVFDDKALPFPLQIVELPTVNRPAEDRHDAQHQHGRQRNQQVEDVHGDEA